MKYIKDYQLYTQSCAWKCIFFSVATCAITTYCATQTLYVSIHPTVLLKNDPYPLYQTANKDKGDSGVYNYTEELLVATTSNIYSLPPLTTDYFVKGIKNPCLALNTKTLMFQKHVMSSEVLDSDKFKLKCLPHHMVVGFMKCGTGDLADTLRRHNLISGAVLNDHTVKETHFWENDHNLLCLTMECYLQMYDTGAEKILQYLKENKNDSRNSELSTLNNQPIFGDYTAQYAYQANNWLHDEANTGENEPSILVPQKIQKFIPNSKIIISMRDPTDRLRSHFNHQVAGKTKHNKGFKPPSQSELHNHVVKGLKWWKKCTSFLSEKLCAYGPRKHENEKYNLGISGRKVANMISYGMYATHIKEYLKVFKRSQLHFVKLEDVQKYKVQVYKENIFRFLGISSFNDTFYRDLSEKSHRVRPYYLTFANKTISMLNKFYKPYNKRLVELLDDDNFKWYYD